MAVNPNGSLKNRHCIVIGTSGAGKSQALKNLIPGKGVRLVAFDPDGDHIAPSCLFDDVRHFAKALKAADMSGKPFRIGLQGSRREHFQAFCTAVFCILDGRKETHIIFEEAAQFTRGSGPAEEEFGNILLRSRKYGGIAYVVGQRAAEIPTTARTQCGTKYVGLLETERDAKAASEMIDVPAATLMKTPPDQLRFWKKEAGKAAEYVRFKYKGN